MYYFKSRERTLNLTSHHRVSNCRLALHVLMVFALSVSFCKDLMVSTGPAKVYTLRGKYRQFFLRVTAENVDEFISTNLVIKPERILDVVVETVRILPAYLESSCFWLASKQKCSSSPQVNCHYRLRFHEILGKVLLLNPTRPLHFQKGDFIIMKTTAENGIEKQIHILHEQVPK